jgi:hypothetical protein
MQCLDPTGWNGGAALMFRLTYIFLQTTLIDLLTLTFGFRPLAMHPIWFKASCFFFYGIYAMDLITTSTTPTITIAPSITAAESYYTLINIKLHGLAPVDLSSHKSIIISGNLYAWTDDLCDTAPTPWCTIWTTCSRYHVASNLAMLAKTTSFVWLVSVSQHAERNWLRTRTTLRKPLVPMTNWLKMIGEKRQLHCIAPRLQRRLMAIMRAILDRRFTRVMYWICGRCPQVERSLANIE